MISLQTVASSALIVLGLAACGIGALCLAGAGLDGNARFAERMSRDGWVIGTAGLVLLALAFVLRAL